MLRICFAKNNAPFLCFSLPLSTDVNSILSCERELSYPPPYARDKCAISFNSRLHCKPWPMVLLWSRLRYWPEKGLRGIYPRHSHWITVVLDQVKLTSPWITMFAGYDLVLSHNILHIYIQYIYIFHMFPLYAQKINEILLASHYKSIKTPARSNELTTLAGEIHSNPMKMHSFHMISDEFHWNLVGGCC